MQNIFKLEGDPYCDVKMEMMAKNQTINPGDGQRYELLLCHTPNFSRRGSQKQ